MQSPVFFCGSYHNVKNPSVGPHNEAILKESEYPLIEKKVPSSSILLITHFRILKSMEQILLRVQKKKKKKKVNHSFNLLLKVRRVLLL